MDPEKAREFCIHHQAPIQSFWSLLVLMDLIKELNWTWDVEDSGVVLVGRRIG